MHFSLVIYIYGEFDLRLPNLDCGIESKLTLGHSG